MKRCKDRYTYYDNSHLKANNSSMLILLKQSEENVEKKLSIFGFRGGQKHCKMHKALSMDYATINARSLRKKKSYFFSEKSNVL